jgi:hypothetical protein
MQAGMKALSRPVEKGQPNTFPATSCFLLQFAENATPLMSRETDWEGGTNIGDHGSSLLSPLLSDLLTVFKE